MRLSAGLCSVVLSLSLILPAASRAQTPGSPTLIAAPDRRPDEGRGPFNRLVLKGGILIDGSGAPPRGPVDITIEKNRIVSIRNADGTPPPGGRRGAAPETNSNDEVLDVTGKYVMPGFINLHVHGGEGKAPPIEYVYKLWMAHGITTVRGVALGPEEWTYNEQKRSAENKTVAPRIVPFFWPPADLATPEAARKWVDDHAKLGMEGLKLTAFRPEIMGALIDEAHKLHLGTTAHLAQLGMAQMNAQDACRLGLDCLEHFYGIFEALYKDSDVQDWPADMNYNDEAKRFGQVARNWDKIHPPGSPEWKALLKEFYDHRFILDSTMCAYLASRDLMRSRNADWHSVYTLPSLWAYYQPSRKNHGSYFYDWTTSDEVAWRRFYQVWMQFIHEYNNMGGRVTLGDDAAFIYSLWGFAYINEMELYQEAGLNPLEIIRSATMYGAQAIFEPKGKEIEYGVIRPGLLADFCICSENPLANFKVLYGTGTMRLNDATGKVDQVGGVDYTIKDGIIYDAKKMLADVAEMVKKAKIADAGRTTAYDFTDTSHIGD